MQKEKNPSVLFSEKIVKLHNSFHIIWLICLHGESVALSRATRDTLFTVSYYETQ